jgi:hypothetical protein
LEALEGRINESPQVESNQAATEEEEEEEEAKGRS